ncbi:hypothetical protein Srufu_041020 [Streptomyces libani subsp. rufus]|nr:hypothetical protein Srufu_041020 [Streptomyces libani subsp. rufus]
MEENEFPRAEQWRSGTMGRVTYVVSVDTRLPAGAAELDALQREGVIFLLRKGLDAIEAVEGRTTWKSRSSIPSWPLTPVGSC